MITWLTALHGGKVLSPASYAEMVTASTLNDGTPLRYGMGLQVGPDPNEITYIVLEVRIGDRPIGTISVAKVFG